MNKKKTLLYLLWIAEGIIVGFGAILPGISGGTLCVAFGMYKPVIETLSHPKSGLRKNGIMLLLFLGGALAGFVALSGLAAMLLNRNTALVTCIFAGFIIGTFPELWSEAGAKGRTKGSITAMVACFLLMLAVLAMLKSGDSITIMPNTAGFALCGVLWGLSFIVPGLSSSSLLLFFGLYQPMLAGISAFKLSVLVPMGAAMALCLLLLSRIIGNAYQRHYSAAAHGIIGIVAATTVMIFPTWNGEPGTLLQYAAATAAGAAVSYFFSRLCARIKQKAEA